MVEHDLGCLFIVAAPSGGGKTSLVNQLINNLDQIEVSISHTTRIKRPGEANGVDYFFVDENVFNQMIQEGDFVEHAQVFNHWYGTSFAQIHDRLQTGIDVVLDIDWQGARQIRQKFPNSIGVFIIPPSVDILKQRLTNRQQDDEKIITSRMNRAHDELTHYDEFDYLIVNDDFTKAANELKSIVIAHRLSFPRQSIKQRKLLSFLLASQ